MPERQARVRRRAISARGGGAVDALAVVLQVAGRQRAQHRFVAQPSDGQHVQTLDTARAEGAHRRLESPRLGLPGGGDPVREEQDPRMPAVAGQPLAEPAERPVEVGGPERPAGFETPHLGPAEPVRRALEDRHHLLVEYGDPKGRAAAGAVAQTGGQLLHPAHLVGIAQGTRRARIDEHVEAGDLLRHRFDGSRDARHGEVALTEAGAAPDPVNAVLADLEVAVGGPGPLVQLDDAAVADLAVEVALHPGGGTAAEEHTDVEPADLRESQEREDVALVAPLQGMRIGDDQLLARPRRDREDAGRELVAGLLLE